MELYISDHPLDCLTCSANGDCELQDMAGVTGLRNVRYGVGAAAVRTTCDATKDESNPYFTYDASEVHRVQPLRACLRRNAGHISPSPSQAAASTAACRPVKTSPSWTANACPAVPACEACPTATLQEKSIIELGQPEHSLITTCAYCGVGCWLQGRDEGQHRGAHGALERWQGQ
jgi:formate dehydrogenase major subunit